MLRFGAVMISAMAVAVLPAGVACGSETAPAAAPPPAPAFQPHPQLQSQYQFRAAPAWPASAPRGETGPGSPMEWAALPPGQGNSYSYGLAGSAGPSLNLKPRSYASRPGWAFSGRVGPVRWLTPLDGEGDTRMRFGGRVPGQPRLPGLGLFNVGVHYAFE